MFLFAFLGIIFLTIEHFDGLSDKDSELLHHLNAGVIVNGMLLFQGDIVHDKMVSDIFSKRKKRGLARQPYRLWDKNIVPYSIDENIGLRKLHALESAMHSWEANTCIIFRKKQPSDKQYVRFTSGKGCYATIGKGDGEQLLSLGKGCGTPGFALHELAHVLGFFHEQSRPDRDDFVDIIWEHIRDDKREQFAKYTELEIDPRGIPYDYLSITHYGPYDFRSQPGLETLKVKKLAENPADMGQRRYLSGYDIIGANTLYQCTQHLEEQCKYGTRYIDTEVRDLKQYACKDSNNQWDICSMPIIKTRKIMVCNWNSTQFEMEKKKVEPTGYIWNGVDAQATSTTEMCLQRVPHDKEIEVPCGGKMCKKIITEYRDEERPCWGQMDDSGYNPNAASWSDWSPWSPCNKPCSRGIQLRFRMCIKESDGSQSSHCPGFRRAVRTCCNGPCYKDIIVQQQIGNEPAKTLKVKTRECPVSLQQMSAQSPDEMSPRERLYSDVMETEEENNIDLGDEEL